METLCTIIAQPYREGLPPIVDTCVPLKEAITRADRLEYGRAWQTVRVYAETNNGATLTLIYQPTGDASR